MTDDSANKNRSSDAAVTNKNWQLILGAVVVVFVGIVFGYPQPDLKYDEDILPLARTFVGLHHDSSNDQPLADLKVVITGATSGIGMGLTEQFHNLGATVVAMGRNPKKLASLQEMFGKETIIPIQVELSDLKSVAKAADKVLKLGRIDILVNNAGIHYDASYPFTFTKSRPRSPQGWDMSFAINYLSHVLLTEKLTKRLGKSPHGTVLHIASTFHFGVSGKQLRSVDGEPPQAALGDFDPLWLNQQAYSSSKLAQILYSRAFQRRHPEIRSKSICPCWVGTNIGGAGAGLLLHIVAYPYNGYGVKSALTAVLKKTEEVDFYTNSPLTALATPLTAADGLARDVGVFILAIFFLSFSQRFGAAVTPQAGSRESQDESLQESLYLWSFDAITDFL